MFSGIPFTRDDEVTMFQVFPDYSGAVLNSLGNACDQVIVYGKLNNGAICENNDVEVYGRRDSHNNIIAKSIKNKASGTTVKPFHSISPGVIRIITAIVVALIVAIFSRVSAKDLIWAAIIILCLINLPIIIKLVGIIIRGIFSLFRRLFR